MPDPETPTATPPFVDTPTPPDQQGPVPPSLRSQVAAQTAAQAPGAQPAAISPAAAAGMGGDQSVSPSVFKTPGYVYPGSAAPPESEMRELSPKEAAIRHDSFGAKVYHGILNALG